MPAKAVAKKIPGHSSPRRRRGLLQVAGGAVADIDRDMRGGRALASLDDRAVDLLRALSLIAAFLSSRPRVNARGSI